MMSKDRRAWDIRLKTGHGAVKQHGFTNAIVRKFLHSNLSLILILLAAALGVAALLVTPREEDPQIVVPLADVYRELPRPLGRRRSSSSSPRRWRRCSTRSTAWSTSTPCRAPDQAIVTVRFYVGEDRERSLVKLYNKIDENVDIVPPGVTGWVVKPVEIDDVPIVTLTLTSATGDDVHACAAWPRRWSSAWRRCRTSRGRTSSAASRATVHVYLDPDRMPAYNVSPLEVQRAIAGANVTRPAGDFTRGRRRSSRSRPGTAFAQPDELQGPGRRRLRRTGRSS